MRRQYIFLTTYLRYPNILVTDTFCTTLSLESFLSVVSGSWDVENPEKIALPSPDPGEYVDVKCIAEVGDRIWVGAGPSIFLLDAETHSREVQ